MKKGYNMMRHFYASAFLSLLLVLVSCSKAESQKDAPKPVTPPKEVTGDMMIGIYVAPDINHTTDAHYRNIKEANVDLIQDISLHYSQTDKMTMLGMALKHGLKMFVADSRVNGSDADIAAMVNTYKSHPAVAGYYIKDEPRADELQDAANRYRRIAALDPEKTPHVNLFPNYATGALAGIDYKNEYLEKWIQLVGPENLQYLTFDNYPFMEDGTLRDGLYYQNLELVRELGLKYKIATSSYLQSIGTSVGLRRPNANELRYSAYTNLAYGIKMPVWFTYWTPGGGEAEQFSNAIVDISGNKTDLYTPFQEINAQIKQLGKTLIKLDAVAVYHAGTTIPSGMKRTPASFVFKAANEDQLMLISHFVDPSTKKVYIMVVNRSLTDSQTFTFKTSDGVTDVKEISKTDGQEKSADYAAAQKQLTATFLPGEGRLYVLSN